MEGMVLERELECLIISVARGINNMKWSKQGHIVRNKLDL